MVPRSIIDGISVHAGPAEIEDFRNGGPRLW